MNNYFSLLVASIAIFFCSCSKEDVNGTITNSGTSYTSANAEAAIFQSDKMVHYGALIDAPSTTGSLDFQINVANSVGISCLRSRTLVPGNGKIPILNKGYKILLNFNSDNKVTPAPFVSDLT